jgi:hypothetical protein
VVLVLVVLVPNSREILVLCFFGHAIRTPEVQVIVRLFEVLAPYSKKLRVRRYHNAVQPTWKEKEEREANVSGEKGLEDPECTRFEYVSKEAEGQSETS